MKYCFITVFSVFLVSATLAQNTAPRIPAQSGNGLSFPNQVPPLDNLNNANSVQNGGLQPVNGGLPNSNSLQSFGLVGQTGSTQFGTSQAGMSSTGMTSNGQPLLGTSTFPGGQGQSLLGTSTFPGGQGQPQLGTSTFPGGQGQPLLGTSNFPGGQSSFATIGGQNIPSAFGNIGRTQLPNTPGMQNGLNTFPGMGMPNAGGLSGFQNIPGGAGFNPLLNPNLPGVQGLGGQPGFAGQPGFTGQPGIPGTNAGLPQGGLPGLFSQGCHTRGCTTGQQCVYTPQTFAPTQGTNYMCPTWIPVLPCQCRAGCRAQNQFIPFGQSRQIDQCGNICTCSGTTGQAACTMRTCPQTGKK